ncbi:MAG: acylphosphatase [Cyanobacteria bacterium J06559_3]
MIVHGRVQGVGFRYHTRLQATQLGLAGYVRNLPNGTVEIMAEGARQLLEQLMEWAKEGPPAAAVTQLEPTYSDASGEFSDFLIQRS